MLSGMHMGLGGNPYGPAGTGKTESVKALGGLFGRQVLVFNCDEVGIESLLLDSCSYYLNACFMNQRKKQWYKINFGSTAVL